MSAQLAAGAVLAPARSRRPRTVSVHPRWRRRGRGAVLVTALIEAANAPSRELLCACGFEEARDGVCRRKRLIPEA